MRRAMIAMMAAVMVFGLAGAAYAEELKPVKLPAPQTDGGMPLMQALKARSSSRAFSTRQLDTQVLSNMLWAAFGVNRPADGKRTAPSAMVCPGRSTSPRDGLRSIA